ncbi:MAG: VWA domain-containing protein [Candidatus Micrarchaeota archaeon]
MDKVKKNRKGIFFTIDAVFALLALLSIVSLFTLVSVESVSSELMHETLHFQTGDMIGLMAKVKLIDLWDQQLVRDLYYSGFLNDEDLNNTLLEVEGALWSLNESNNSEAATNLTTMLFGNLVSDNVDWAFIIDNEVFYNTTVLDYKSRMVAVSRRLVSGYMKSQPHVGYAARAFLSNILGKQSSSYLFFGGFVGQGNITAVIGDIPPDANVSYIYMEMNIGTNFTLYINNEFCGVFNKSGGNFSVNSWNVDYPWCLGNLSLGNATNFTLNFIGDELIDQYIGGGYIRVVYDTSEFGDITSGVERYYFPGIDGIINLYDSFYVPGNITNISGYLKFYNNYSTELIMGNQTVFGNNGTDAIQEIYLDDANFTLLDYIDLSQVTVPLRLRAAANITGGTLGNADVVLITDVSGSMNWRVGYSDTTAGQTWGNDCSNTNMYTSPETQRLALARCLDKQFIDIVMNGSGNQIALVSFSNQVQNWTDLTNNEAYLNSTVDTYSAVGGTCICCAINKAREILAAQSSIDRLKFIIVMSDGIAGYRCHNVGSCYWWDGEVSPTGSSLYGVSFINDTHGFAVGTRVGGGRIVEWDGTTWSILLNIGTTLRGVHMYSETLGFAVGDAGLIMKWDGTSWANDPSPVGSRLRSAFIVNDSLAYAVGDSGRVLTWDGTNWVLTDTFAGTLYSVAFNENRTQGFIVGSGGQIYNWTDPGWAAQVSPTAQDLRDVAFVNRTDYWAYAVGYNGAIIRWNGTGWSSDTSPTGRDLFTNAFINETLGYALGENGRIVKWNSTDWTIDYSPTSYTLYGSEKVNDALAFAVGSSGRILKWTPPLWNGTNTVGSQCCGGGSGDCDNPECESAMMNAIWSSSYVNQTIDNVTVDSIGFGPISSCENANFTLRGIAEAGNGTYFVSDNATELQLIYEQLGLRILISATITQEINVTGTIETTLFPESYLQFNFNTTIPPLGYKEISIIQETNPFDNCTGNFTIPEWFTPYDARVTSYSAEYWTHNVSVMSSSTGGIWQNVYNLSVYTTPYDMLGDPFNIRFPAALLTKNETNFVDVRTGLEPENDTAECSTGNRVIYKARFPASVPFSSILPYAEGRNLTVYYDLDGDGVPDGSQNVVLAYGLEGIPFDPILREVDELDITTNAIDDAFIRLLDYINFNDQRNPAPGCVGDERSGSTCNPVDLELSPYIVFRISSVTEVPYLWGPIDMGIITWIKEGD